VGSAAIGRDELNAEDTTHEIQETNNGRIIAPELGWLIVRGRAAVPGPADATTMLCRRSLLPQSTHVRRV
jgi:hypothetical protein